MPQSPEPSPDQYLKTLELPFSVTQQQIDMCVDAMSGISRAKPGSVRRLVEAVKDMFDVDPNAYWDRVNAALAEIELEQENAK